jgi:hypothetical protein
MVTALSLVNDNLVWSDHLCEPHSRLDAVKVFLMTAESYWTGMILQPMVIAVDNAASKVYRHHMHLEEQHSAVEKLAEPFEHR